MKRLNNFIFERLKLNKDTKINDLVPKGTIIWAKHDLIIPYYYKLPKYMSFIEFKRVIKDFDNLEDKYGLIEIEKNDDKLYYKKWYNNLWYFTFKDDVGKMSIYFEKSKWIEKDLLNYSNSLEKFFNEEIKKIRNYDNEYYAIINTKELKIIVKNNL